jgi:hypothetical protein
MYKIFVNNLKQRGFLAQSVLAAESERLKAIKE